MHLHIDQLRTNPARMDLPKRIKSERRRRGLTQGAMAEELGVSQSTVSRWEKGQEPRHEELKAIATFLGEDLNVLIGLAGSSIIGRVRPIDVIGSVEAGAWREAIEWPVEDRYQVFALRDPRFEGCRKGALEVRGPSMNKDYPPGSVVVFADIHDLGREPESGEKVVVYRRSATGEWEATVKQYQVDDRGEVWLWPRSEDPNHQTPIRLNGVANGEEITIAGVVFQSIRLE